MNQEMLGRELIQLPPDAEIVAIEIGEKTSSKGRKVLTAINDNGGRLVLILEPEPKDG